MATKSGSILTYDKRITRQMTLWSRGQVRSRKWFKGWPQEATCLIENFISPLLLGLCHHIGKGGEVWLFDREALQGHMKNLKWKLNFFLTAQNLKLFA